jgi:secreted PhoX family phosphatase
MADRSWPRSQAAEEAENGGTNASANPTMGEIIAARYRRRDLLRGALAVTAISATVSPLAVATAEQRKAQAANTAPLFAFKEVPAGADERHHVAEGYNADVLIRWGDPVLAGAPAFDPMRQTAEAQKRQFGYNNDFVGYFPLPGADPNGRGLLVVNHEYTSEELMFPGLGRQDAQRGAFRGMTKELAEIEMAAHGGSVIEVRKIAGRWQVATASRYARRITAETPMEITGPAAGSPRLKTSADPQGKRVLGMLNNCAGGTTPWGTWLTCEENVNGYFSGTLADDHPEARNYKRMGVPGGWFNWGSYLDRFDVTKEPNEANRFGWVVEIDPFDPSAIPKKRTAMGRFKHEGAAGLINRDGRYVLYQGDDERFDYVYKFVTEARVDLVSPAANRDILDRGTLYVARYDGDGTGRWLPLVHGEGPLTEANGFGNQGDVVIETRRAADLLGATKMDRPEDVEANAKTNKVYVMLTNNTWRKPEHVGAANPRPDNRFGHIIEMLPDGGDHAATGFTWEILLKCGDPSIAAVGATFSPATSKDGWFGMPDNCAIDSEGRLWIATDGNSPGRTGRSDGLWVVGAEGEARRTSRHFFRGPLGAELTGPCFTPDETTLFLAVQHPGLADGDDPNARAATFEDPTTRWPDFRKNMPPRPSIVVVTKRGGGKIAS